MAGTIQELLLAEADVIDALETGSVLGQASAIKRFAQALEPNARVITEQDIQGVQQGVGQASAVLDLARVVGWEEGQAMTEAQRAQFEPVLKELVENRLANYLTTLQAVDTLYGDLVPEGTIDRRLEVLSGFSREQLRGRVPVELGGTVETM